MLTPLGKSLPMPAYTRATRPLPGPRLCSLPTSKPLPQYARQLDQVGAAWAGANAGTAAHSAPADSPAAAHHRRLQGPSRPRHRCAPRLPPARHRGAAGRFHLSAQPRAARDGEFTSSAAARPAMPNLIGPLRVRLGKILFHHHHSEAPAPQRRQPARRRHAPPLHSTQFARNPQGAMLPAVHRPISATRLAHVVPPFINRCRRNHRRSSHHVKSSSSKQTLQLPVERRFADAQLGGHQLVALEVADSSPDSPAYFTLQQSRRMPRPELPPPLKDRPPNYSPPQPADARVHAKSCSCVADRPYQIGPELRAHARLDRALKLRTLPGRR